MFVNAIG